MRMDQYIGLTPKGNEMASGKITPCTIEKTLVFPNGKRQILPSEAVSWPESVCEDSGEKFVGMFEEDYNLSKYRFPDGRVYHEFLQAQIHSSGPMFFIALKDAKGTVVDETLWTEEEMNKY